MEGRFNGGFFALPVWGAYIWRGLFSEFYGTSKTESVVVEEIKEVELRSRRAQFIYDRNYNQNRWNLTKSNISYRFFVTEFETGYWRR